MSKSLFVFCDGTWNTPEQEDEGQQAPTNVFRLYQHIKETPQQVRYYDTGVGTQGGIDSLTGGAFGYGLYENIQQAYQFIIEYYEPGTKIYLFGFSRGAYTVRSLAGLIDAVGILTCADCVQIERAYQLYRESYQDKKKLADFFKQNSHPSKQIEFVGVWDTVGALGIPLRSLHWITASKYEFHNTELGSHIRHGYHAVAIDEKRRQFEPVLWSKSEGDSNQKPLQHIEQRWFVGSHSNVGGGYRDQRLADITLHWMKEKLSYANPKIQFDGVLELNRSHKGELIESRGGMYLASWVDPEIRKVFSENVLNETIDPTVYERIACKSCDYHPENIPVLQTP